MSDFTTGRQPCAKYTPQIEGNAYATWANVHECFGPYVEGVNVRLGSCSGRVSFCESCTSDHHSGGWETCGQPAGDRA